MATLTVAEKKACDRYRAALMLFEDAAAQLKETFRPKWLELCNAGKHAEAHDYVSQMPVASVERTIMLANTNYDANRKK